TPTGLRPQVGRHQTSGDIGGPYPRVPPWLPRAVERRRKRRQEIGGGSGYRLARTLRLTGSGADYNHLSRMDGPGSDPYMWAARKGPPGLARTTPAARFWETRGVVGGLTDTRNTVLA